MIDRHALVRDLSRELRALEPDLRRRTEEDPTLAAELTGEYERAFALGRTAATYGAWRDRQVTQAAVAWLLGGVFVRFCEDNALVRPVWLAGPPRRRAEAVERHEAYFRANPERNDRDWLLEAMGHFRDLPATAGVFDRRNPLWRIRLSADAAERLVRFWRRTGPDGELARDFRDPELDTRFLGDLYQDLSEEARQEFALLQTPEFVEEFILDRTLERAIRERGGEVQGLRLIDPACGSGHFLLGAFQRLLRHWHREAPNMDARVRVKRVLDAIHGVDLNPFAVAITRFRLAVAAMRAGGDRALEPGVGYKYHLAVGDSLLHGTRQRAFKGMGMPVDDEELVGFAYAGEDLFELRAILKPGAYDVVVANPPYVTVKDAALNRRYRDRYETCYREYALTVPFCERLFELAKRPDGHGRNVGWVGTIMSNSFMKREFGKKLIEEFLAKKDLMEVIDTSGAYIPGHGTPTLIIVGRNRPANGRVVRCVLSVRGEASVPDDPASAVVWRSIVAHVDGPGWNDSWITVTDLHQAELSTHPWSLNGGPTRPAMVAIQRAAANSLKSRIESIGRTTNPGEDDAYFITPWRARSMRALGSTRRIVIGKQVRDYILRAETLLWWPYRDGTAIVSIEPDHPLARVVLWPYRAVLRTRRIFGRSLDARGGSWTDYLESYPSKLKGALSIASADIATHNHFVLDRGGKVFKQTAPVIKLPEGATEEDHLRLLGVLNSSTACFWLKCVCYPKGGDPVGDAGARVSAEGWDDRYAFNASNLERFPLPAELPLDIPRRLDALGQRLAAATPAAVCAAGTPTRAALDLARRGWEGIRGQMIALQEELDWRIYRHYGLLREDLTYPHDDLPPLALGERAFEIVLARRVGRGEEETAWFERHGSIPITEMPGHWPATYRALVERRIAAIEERRDIALIERPECKRRWHTDPWPDQERKAIRAWVLDRLERERLWSDPQGRPRARSVAQLAGDLAHDTELQDVLALYTGNRDCDVATELGRLLDEESVPFLAACRYTEAGLRKRADWERVWELQRREDAGDEVGRIPVPPRYAPADFARTSYWRWRGKLDVPKERFIAYPAAERDGDRSNVYGWAGWDYLRQAQVLATLVLHRSHRDGWTAERLTPLLAGLAELQPWLRQWHAAPDPAYSGPPADYMAAFLDAQLAEHGLTRQQLAAWRPERRRGPGGGRRRAKGASAADAPGLETTA